MTAKQKAALCAFGVGALTFLGGISSSLCAGLPAPYNGICILAGKAAVEGAKHIQVPDAGQ